MCHAVCNGSFSESIQLKFDDCVVSLESFPACRPGGFALRNHQLDKVTESLKETLTLSIERFYFNPFSLCEFQRLVIAALEHFQRHCYISPMIIKTCQHLVHPLTPADNQLRNLTLRFW